MNIKLASTAVKNHSCILLKKPRTSSSDQTPHGAPGITGETTGDFTGVIDLHLIYESLE